MCDFVPMPIRLSIFILLTRVGFLLADPGPAGGNADSSFVDVSAVAPSIVVDLPYATASNFLKRKLYPANKCFLRKAVAERLAKVQADLEELGYGLKILDGYRPLSVQREMWKILPDSRFVANPATGSRHNRGAAVDVTLVTRSKEPVKMPTEFDDFSAASHVDARTSKEAASHRAILQSAMKRRGFLPLTTEWWHFDSPEWKTYSLEDFSFEELERVSR